MHLKKEVINDRIPIPSISIVKIGVPQGSQLSPLLKCVIQFNHIHSYIIIINK